MSGLKISALYGFPAQRLGLCGMQKENCQEKVFDFVLGKKVKNIEEILKTFEGAFSYYQIIAKENKISNPFDKKVVRAYWIGNDLLERLRISTLKKLVKEKIKKPKLAKIIPDFSRAHHSFHVLVAGPIRKDLILTEGMKDLCKISWGRVSKIGDCKLKILDLVVEYQPVLKEKEWFLGKPIKRKIFLDKRILPKLKIGDWISFHWDFALEKLSKRDLKNLKKYTENSIKIANMLKI